MHTPTSERRRRSSTNSTYTEPTPGPRPLTAAAIQSLQPGDYLADANERGLRVVAYPHRKAFLYRYRGNDGRLRQVTIGDARKLPIAEARQRVRELRQARDDGHDPRLVRREAVAEVAETESQDTYTVGKLVEDYAGEHLAKLKRGAERKRMLEHDVGQWRRREAARITRDDIKSLIEDIAGRAPDTAGRVLRELRAAYVHAADKKRIGEGVNPAATIKAPKESRYVPRSRAFAVAEWRTLLRWLPESGFSDDVADALRLIAFTACRPGEASSAKWADIDLRSGTWTIRERKRDGEHLVFLSKPAIALLRARRNGSAFVFPSPSKRDKPIREHAIVWAIVNARDKCPVAHWTAHDVRRSSATLLQAQGAPFDVVRRVLGHYSTRNPTDIYARHRFDREAKAAWSKLGTVLAKWAAK